MSSGLSRLPQELVDHIVDHLHDDPASLLACATVCRGWLPASRVHLFARIHLDIAHTVNARCTRLCAVLDENADILPLVHELHITELCAPNGPVTAVALPALLARLVHLRRVELVAKLPTARWDQLKPPLRRAIEAVFRLPSLTYVRLSRWTFPSWDKVSSLFRHSIGLLGVSLKEIVFLVEQSTPNEDASLSPHDEHALTDNSGANTPRAPHLTFLTLDFVDFTNLNEWLEGPMDMTRIREFRLAHSDAMDGDKLLHACGSSLERFHFKPGSSGTTICTFLLYLTIACPLTILVGPPLDLGYCSNLRSLRLTLEEYPDILGWVFDVISSIPVCGTLEHVALEFFIDPKKLGNWVGIDEVLSRFDSLKEVAIGVFAQHTHAEFLRVQDDMRGLRERQVLRVYELARRTQSHKLCSRLTPMISSFEEC